MAAHLVNTNGINKVIQKKVGLAGAGAIGGAVAKALVKGIDGFELRCISDPNVSKYFDVDYVDFDVLADSCDLVIECLPAHIVPDLTARVFDAGKDILFISSAALLIYPQIMHDIKDCASKAYMPSGALCGLDGVRAMREMGITSSVIASTKPPRGFTGAPFVVENNIDVAGMRSKTLIFEGNALEAAKGFPANVNVAASLAFAGIGAEQTRVEIWADPDAKGNAHEITVKSDYSTLNARIENLPDPANPKSSVLAAQSIVATLRNMSSAFMLT